MNLKTTGVYALFIAMLAFCSVAASQTPQPTEIEYDMQRLDARFRVFKTRNIWNTLHLDTQTGQLWQVQIALKDEDRMKTVLNKDVLASTGSRPGRFTLYSSRNMYQFILLDQDNGRVWQVQWSIDGNSGFWPIEEKKGASEWKR
ncbi:hypothetical protein [Limnohabitans sp.]|jgi:hypothetical protein|uniref:hypothetical protein n=1 Tax=Limnohabitans sp. TaxID=1907725 RepID=UPI00289F6323|nr:hypothetical protein [Limnohabitans sp.]